MLDITQLYCSHLTSRTLPTQTPGPAMEAVAAAPFLVPFSMAGCKPRVVWQVTQSCNMNCLNCASNSRPRNYAAELSSHEAVELIDDLAGFDVPQLIFGGGEPLMRPDLLELVAHARKRNILTSLSTNGTLLTPANVAGLKRAGIHSVSVLLEGLGWEVDRQRGVRGAFEATVEGYRSCQAAGLDVGFHTPLNRWTFQELHRIFDWAERLHVRRLVFSHLVYAGRGNSPENDLTHAEKRRALDLILERAEDLVCRSVGMRIGTSENYVDGVYLYLQLVRKNPVRALRVLTQLQACESGVYGAGVGLAGIDSTGNVHPDPHWHRYVLGNIRETPFSKIWAKPTDPLLVGLRDRLPLLKGRCAHCRWQEACGGSLRVRAEECFDDPWMTDPACYLTGEEINKELPDQVEAMEDDVLLPEQAA